MEVQNVIQYFPVCILVVFPCFSKKQSMAVKIQPTTMASSCLKILISMFVVRNYKKISHNLRKNNSDRLYEHN